MPTCGGKCRGRGALRHEIGPLDQFDFPFAELLEKVLKGDCKWN